MKGLYFVTDRGLCGANPLTDVVLQAIRGGAVCVQLREKDVSTRFFVEEAGRIKALMAPFHVPLIINDRLDVALAVGADGVHVGQSDMPYETARKLMGPRAIIGLSVETWEDVERAAGARLRLPRGQSRFCDADQDGHQGTLGSGRARQDPGLFTPSAGWDRRTPCGKCRGGRQGRCRRRCRGLRDLRRCRSLCRFP